MTSENNSVESEKSTPVADNVQNNPNQTPPAVEGVRGPEPLKTYEQMNIDAPVVSAAAIEERLARKRSEAGETNQDVKSETAQDSAAGSEENGSRKSPLSERVQSSRESRARREDRGDRWDRPRRDSRGGRDRGGRDRNAEDETPAETGPALPTGKVPIPNLRVKSDDLEAELEEMFQGNPLDNLMTQAGTIAGQEIFEDSTKVQCKIVSIQKDFAFVDLGARDQGVIPLKQFPEDSPAQAGDVVDGVVIKYNNEEGLYEVSLPLAAAEVGDWSSVSAGMVVEARITGINKGGLECEVGKLRGFLPLGQMATFRVENPEQFVGESWKCIVTEVNPLRRNLVVSRRALMERENEEKREKLLAELAVGQVREGLVRKLIDVGAFVDLGGVDGFIHVSAMSWGRVNHPSDILKEGERIRVTITKIDLDRNRISLSFKDASMDPWRTVKENFKEGDQTRGKVTAVMPFGAFVEIMPGVEGLVHISEISYQRVANVSDALSPGDWVDVKIISIDEENRKMSLSIKQTTEDPRVAERAASQAAQSASEAEALAADEAKEKAEEDALEEKIRKNRPKGPLKGGVSSQSEGSKFGLNW